MTTVILTESLLVRTACTTRFIGRVTGRFLQSGIKPLVIAILAVSAVFTSLVTVVAYLPTLTGLKTMIVTSGSMETNIGTGSAILIEELTTTSIRIGDPISFEGAEGHLVTHRVVAIREIKGETYFQTQGDANEDPDPNLAPAGAVVGRVRAVLPYMGYVLYYSSGKLAQLAMIGLPAIILVALELRSLVTAARKNRAGSKQSPSPTGSTPGVPSVVIPGRGQPAPAPETVMPALQVAAGLTQSLAPL